MRFSVHAARRAVVATALALSATAALTGTAASAAVQHSGRPAATRSCSVSKLVAWLGYPGSGAAGSVTYPLEFTNVSGHRCHLYGFPGVSAIGRAGHQLGSAAGRDRTQRPRLVVLRRGATAHATLQITEAGNFPARRCRVRAAASLRIIPPNRHASAFIPLSFAACSKKDPVYLHIRAIRAGVGIPGFSG